MKNNRSPQTRMNATRDWWRDDITFFNKSTEHKQKDKDLGTAEKFRDKLTIFDDLTLNYD